MYFRRKRTYGSLVVAVLVVAALLFVSPAWSQSGGRTTAKKTEERVVQSNGTGGTSTQTAESPTARLVGQNPSAQEALQAVDQTETTQDLDGETAEVTQSTVKNKIETLEISAPNNCEIVQGDSITFTVDGETNVAFATVVNGVNADISSDGDVVTVDSLARGDPIRFFVERDNGTLATGALSENDTLVVDTSTIDCGSNNGGNNNGGNKNKKKHRHNNNNRNNNNNNEISTSDVQDAEDDLNNIDITDGDITNGESTDGEITSDSNVSTDNGNGSGVSATADENGAEASTPGAVASAGGDADNQPPVTGPQGDVVPEVPVEGPLPNTAGSALWIYGMVGLACVLLGVAIVRKIRASA